jgi:type II secretory pathway component GspD/PulD (secretin)
MQKDPRQVEVIKLRKLDPSVAVLAINKMFGGGEEGASTSGPKVDADPTSLQLIIRGSQSQVEQIRELLGKMGETSLDEKSPLAERSNLRTIPLTGRAANSALEQVQALWPTVHSNKIRTVTPSKSSSLRVPLPPAGKEQPPPAEQPSIVPPLLDSLKLKKSAQTQTGIEARFVAFQQPAPTSPATAPSAGTGTAPSNAEKPKTPAEKPAVETPPPQKTVPGAEIVITVGPGGLIIASEDLDALDALEEMLLQVASQTEASGKEYAVFYLRFAKAEAAVEILQQAMGGGGGSSDAGGGGSLMGDLASSFLGGQGGLLGGLMGGLGGGSGGATSSGPVSMTPDPRLNAILCYGRANDLDLVEQMLKVVDQESSPEDVLTNGRPRFIAVVNADAEEIGTVVKQIYAARIAADSNQQRQPSPEEFIRALRGGGGGRGGSSGAKKSEEQKMTIGIDKRSNSLIVSAPDPLFQEVRLLVEQLDVASTSKDEAVSVVSIKRANPELVERALNSLVGNNATVTRQGGASTKSSSASKTSGTSESRQPTPEQIQDDIRRRVETFNALQQEMSRGRSSSGGATPPRRGN